MGLLLILFPQFSGASRLREAVWTIAPSGVRNLCWHKGLCKPLQDTPGCAINVPDKGPQSSAPPALVPVWPEPVLLPDQLMGVGEWPGALHSPCPVPALLCAIVCSSLLLLPKQGKAFSQLVAIDIG